MMQFGPRVIFPGYGLSISKAREKHPGNEVGGEDDDDDCEDLVMTGAALSSAWRKMIVMIMMTLQELIYRLLGDDNEKLDCDDNG